jgi:flagellin-like hook-associated protein FlgL
MTAINSLSQVNYIRNLINAQQDKLADLTKQSGSGYKSDTFAGLSINDSRVSIASRTELLRAEAYKGTITAVTPRIQVAATTLDSMEGSLVEMRDTLLALKTTDPQGTQIRVAAEAKFRQLIDRLNTKVDGQQIFAGRAAGTAGVGANYPIPDGDTLLANFQTALGGPFGSTNALYTTPVTGVDAFFGTTGAALTNWFQPGDVNGTTADPTKISDTLTLETGLTALPDPTEPNGSTSFRDALSTLATLTTVTPADFTGGLDEYSNFITDAIDKLNVAIEGINEVVAKVGQVGDSLTNQTKVFTDSDLNLKTALAAAEEVDSVQVLSDLQARTTQLEATYKVTAQTRGLNLFNYI